MTKVKLANGTIISADEVTLSNGILAITTTEKTVEELAELFANKENTALITLMTESEIESGYKEGFTSFAGITYAEDGSKTVELFQPTDVTEARLASAEARIAAVEEGQEIQDGAIVELAEIVGGE